jgi:hypothetical protein
MLNKHACGALAAPTTFPATESFIERNETKCQTPEGSHFEPLPRRMLIGGVALLLLIWFTAANLNQVSSSTVLATVIVGAHLTAGMIFLTGFFGLPGIYDVDC